MQVDSRVAEEDTFSAILGQFGGVAACFNPSSVFLRRVFSWRRDKGIVAEKTLGETILVPTGEWPVSSVSGPLLQLRSGCETRGDSVT